MKAEACFIDPQRVRVETETGEVYILGFLTRMNYEMSKKLKWSFTDDLIVPLFDKYYKGDPDVIMGIISMKLMENQCDFISWYSEEYNQERVRIGATIKHLRLQKKIEAKELAVKAGIDAANLCRIEQGRYSVGLDILSKIANALDAKIDVVPINE